MIMRVCCVLKSLAGQHSLWIKGVGKLVQFYCPHQLSNLATQMVSLQMALHYLMVSLCNKELFIAIKNVHSPATWDANVCAHFKSNILQKLKQSTRSSEDRPGCGLGCLEGQKEPFSWC